MNENLYELMDWAAIEAIVYSEEDDPHALLGPHLTEKGVLVQTFIPTAKEVTVKVKGVKKVYPMELADEEDFFAVLIPGKKIPEYSYVVKFDNGNVAEYHDPYSYSPMITEKELVKFQAGICYDVYEKLGAHPMTVDGIRGVYFAVWAPNAVRVSLVGDFVLWDGRRLPMRRLGDFGVFELFVPGLSEGCVYKYEIKAKGDITFLKADPYANAAELRPDTASVVADLTKFSWTDRKYIKTRKAGVFKKEPLSVYEMHVGSFKKPGGKKAFYSYRELAPMVADYVKEMGYTHVELLPVMEHPADNSLGYQTTGYYAPTSRYGSPEDFMYFVNHLHEQGLGVILDWTPAYFAKDEFGLSRFDGTCLYEHLDPRQGIHPHLGTYLYNYARPEVKNFLIANAFFWIGKYHVDGIRVDSASVMLYLDYGKQDGEWVANMYGGNENLEAVEFFKHLNSVFKQNFPGVLLVAEESSSWPMMTVPVEEDGLGFDYKWNTGWKTDLLHYMSAEPGTRRDMHSDLIFSMIYAYSEDFILGFSHDDVMAGRRSMLEKMPGERVQQFANLRAAYGYMMVHPGKKLMFMGQDFAQAENWSENKGLHWSALEDKTHQQMQKYVKALNQFYREHPALYQLDFDAEGFEWINSISANESVLVFARKTKKKEEMLLVVCNFSQNTYENYKIGVPYAGKYKEIFNSDKTEYGGSGVGNSRLKQSKKDECDDRVNSVMIKVPPMAVTVFSYTKVVPKGSSNKVVRSVKAKEPANKKNLKEELEDKYIKARNVR